MSDDWLKDVTVKFEKAFKGPDVKVKKEGTGKKGPWKLYEFQAEFKDETAQTKTHTMKSFNAPGPVGTTMLGDIQLYHGSFTEEDGSEREYTSYTFYPKEDAKPAAQTQTTLKGASEVKLEESAEAHNAAIRRYINFLWSVCTDNGNRSDEVGAAIFPGVRMIVGDYTPLYGAELADAVAEAAGMPTNKELKAAEAAERERGPEPGPDDIPY